MSPPFPSPPSSLLALVLSCAETFIDTKAIRQNAGQHVYAYTCIHTVTLVDTKGRVSFEKYRKINFVFITKNPLLSQAMITYICTSA